MAAMSGGGKIVVLTGAGVSAESGLGTFRDKDGLWTRYDLEEVATPRGFARNPEMVQDFYNQRRRNLLAAVANAAHAALARLQAEHGGEVVIVTQNIDHLHEQSGSTGVIHMHGELLRVRCGRCRAAADWADDLFVETACPACGAAGAMRPDVVWFGEMPMHMAAIEDHLQGADLFVSVGTSGSVYPAAGFVDRVRALGRAHTVELNLQPSDGASAFAERIHGPATQVVPAFVARLLDH